MTLRLRIRPEAEADLASACLWYEGKSSGLSDQLLDEVNRTLTNILQNPHLYTKVHKDIRRALVRRFPFGVYFVETAEEIVVLALFHQAQNPRRWKARKI